MGIRHPLIAEIAKDTWHINEFGLDSIYMLKGSKRSLVIDCGSGLFDLRAMVEAYVGNEFDVVVTHGHGDHCGMIRQFERVYVPEKDLEMVLRVKNRTEPMNMHDTFYANNNQHLGRDWAIWDVDESMFNTGTLDTEVLPINEGKVFDLGNRKVTTYELNGHSPGHLYFIDDYSRIAFTGDCVNHDNGSKYAVSTHIRDIQKLLDMYGVKYDRIFTGHQTYCGELDVRSHSMKIVQNLADAYRALLRGEAEFEWRTHHLYPDREPPHRVIVYGEGDDRVVVAFNENRFWEEGEEHIVP